MKKIAPLFVLALLAACAAKETRPDMTSTEARAALENKWNDLVGKAQKADFVESFGTANWCRPKEPNGETCRFYKKVGTKWMGEEGRDKKSLETYDEVVAVFDGGGKLRSFEANAQR